MDERKHFTCINYDNVDFLIPSQYIISGIYLHVPKEAKNLVFNKETLPHIYIGEFFEKEFQCQPVANANAVIVLNSKDFAKDVCKDIVTYTDTAFPATGNLALSLTSNITSKLFELPQLHLFPKGIKTRMTDCGIIAVHFPDSSRKQILISPDFLLRRFFAGAFS